MDQAVFEQWKMQLELLDRYERQADCQMFLAMVEAVTHCGHCLMDEKFTRMQTLRLHNEGELD